LDLRGVEDESDFVSDTEVEGGGGFTVTDWLLNIE
jgi:hypothetical protein